VSLFLILLPVSGSFFSLLDASAIIGLPLAVLAFLLLLVRFLLLAARLVSTETRKDEFTLLRLTNISPDTIFWSLLLAIIYHTRRWLVWIIGGFPFFLWLICFWYMRLSSGNLLLCYVSLLGHKYCSPDGSTYFTGLWENFWFLSMTISILSIAALSLLCAVGFTMKSKNRVSYMIVILMLAVPLILVIMLVIAPEGFLLIDSSDLYQLNLIVDQVCLVGIGLAALPCIAAFGAQHRLRRRVLD